MESDKECHMQQQVASKQEEKEIIVEEQGDRNVEKHEREEADYDHVKKLEQVVPKQEEEKQIIVEEQGDRKVEKHEREEKDCDHVKKLEQAVPKQEEEKEITVEEQGDRKVEKHEREEKDCDHAKKLEQAVPKQEEEKQITVEEQGDRNVEKHEREEKDCVHVKKLEQAVPKKEEEKQITVEEQGNDHKLLEKHEREHGEEIETERDVKKLKPIETKELHIDLNMEPPCCGERVLEDDKLAVALSLSLPGENTTEAPQNYGLKTDMWQYYPFTEESFAKFLMENSGAEGERKKELVLGVKANGSSTTDDQEMDLTLKL